MRSIRTTFTLEEALARRARDLGVNISRAARQGVSDAVRRAMAEKDRAAYERFPEEADTFWDEAETWSRD